MLFAIGRFQLYVPLFTFLHHIKTRHTSSEVVKQTRDSGRTSSTARARQSEISAQTIVFLRLYVF